MLHSRPHQAEEESHWNHQGKAHRHYESRAFEDAQPVGNVGIIKAVVKPGRHAGDEDGAQHAHVQGFDIGNHGQACACPSVHAVVNTEESAVQGKEPGDEVVEDHVDDEGLHGAAGLFLLGKADRHGDGKENGHLIEHRPGALLHHIPEVTPHGTLGSQAAEQSLVLADDGNSHRQAEESKQDNRRIHSAAEPLHALHETVFADGHMKYPLNKTKSIAFDGSSIHQKSPRRQ